MFYIFLLLCMSFASTRCRDIRAIEDEPGYYCRYNNEFQICLRFPDEEKPITLKKTDCTCDNIAIRNNEGNSNIKYSWRYFFIEEWNEITPQTQIRNNKEQRAWRQMPYWVSFLKSTGFKLTQRTLWMSEMTPSKAHILKPFVFQIFWCEFGEWFRSILQKSYL